MADALLDPHNFAILNRARGLAIGVRGVAGATFGVAVAIGTHVARARIMASPVLLIRTVLVSGPPDAHYPGPLSGF